MPGIAGVIATDGVDHRDTVARMLESMWHEPFYEHGVSCAPEMGVWAGWVAHAGSFAERESRTHGDIQLAMAGECVQDEHAAVPGDGSARLLNALYPERGEPCVRALNGLFSGLLIDRRSRRAWLFNDRFGVERLYIHEAAHATYFASEAKALLRVVAELRRFDEEGVAQYLAFGCPVDGRTLFHGISVLEGGSLWTFEPGACRKARYFSPDEWERQSELDAGQFQEEFESRFKRVVRRYFDPGVGVGISLTGGLDSRMIMACRPEVGPAPVCYTFSGIDGETHDLRIAARVAAASGVDHRVLRVGRDFLSDYSRHVDRAVYVTDGCAGPTWTHEIYLNAQARRLSPVRVTGNFGSEILRSVSTFKARRLLADLFAPDLRQRISRLAAQLPRRSESPVTFAAFREIPSHLYGIIASARSQLISRTPYLDNDIVALAYRAPMHVRLSPASATALVHHAAPQLAAIPTDRAVVNGGSGIEYAIRRVVAELTFKLDYMYYEDPPMGLARLLTLLHDRGLLASHRWLPYRRWFQHELASYVNDTVMDAQGGDVPFLNRRVVEAVARDHIIGRRNAVDELNAILTLMAVERLLLRPGATVHTNSVDRLRVPAQERNLYDKTRSASCVQ